MRFRFLMDSRKFMMRVPLALALIFCLSLPAMSQQTQDEPDAKQSGDEPDANQSAGEPDTSATLSGWPALKTRDAEKQAQGAPTEYVVGESDILRIKVWKEPEVSQPSITVRPDGMISLPLLGVVKVSGMTPSQIQDMLADKLSRYLNKPHVTVAVTQIKSKAVFLTGEVKRPGVYQLGSAYRCAPTDHQGGRAYPICSSQVGDGPARS